MRSVSWWNCDAEGAPAKKEIARIDFHSSIYLVDLSSHDLIKSAQSKSWMGARCENMGRPTPELCDGAILIFSLRKKASKLRHGWAMRIITGSNNAFDSPEREIEYVLYLTVFDKRGRNEQIGFTHEYSPPFPRPPPPAPTLLAIASLLTRTR